MADQSGGSSAAIPPAPTGMREYRKGNWTLQETMILIEAKKMDDERRHKKTPQQLTMPSVITPGSSSSTSQQQEQMMSMAMMRTSTYTSTKPVSELRWKWVEDYCWRRGCFRSQNQCNDKWDNLMRDYKKVRDYQRSLINNATLNQQQQSYWNMEKNERKERNLPSSMLPTIYDALLQVVDNKPSTSSSPSPASAFPLPPAATTTTTVSGALSLLLQQQQQQVNVAALGLPPIVSTIPGDHGLLLDSDTSSGSSSKRKRIEKRPVTSAGGVGVGPSTDTTSAMCRIIEAMQESEKRQEERHREMVALKKRRMQIEEARVELNRQGMNMLVDAVNNLSNSILALAEANNSGNVQPPPPH